MGSPLYLKGFSHIETSYIYIRIFNGSEGLFINEEKKAILNSGSRTITTYTV